MLNQHGCYNKKRFSSFGGYINKQKYRSASILNFLNSQYLSIPILNNNIEKGKTLIWKS